MSCSPHSRPPALAESLQQDKFGALTVLKAFTWKALRAQEELNCLIDFLLEAFDKAEALDAKFGGKPDKPPLFGLPFSVKGNFYVRPALGEVDLFR